MIQILKKGSGIHIKPENRGKFTQYCHGKVASECIARGKRSSNPAVRKRATFAANARRWKHYNGGIINFAQQGTKVNFGQKVGNFLNSNAGQSLIQGGLSLLQTNAQNKKLRAEADVQKAQNEFDWTQMQQQLIKQNMQDRQQQYNQWVSDYQSGKTLDQPSNIVAQHLGYQQLNQNLTQGRQNLKQKNSQIDTQTSAEQSNNWGDTFSGILQSGLGVVGDYLSNKGTTSNYKNN